MAGILGFGDVVALAAVVFGSFEVVSDVFGDGPIEEGKTCK